jgi:hypothetical protein
MKIDDLVIFCIIFYVSQCRKVQDKFLLASHGHKSKYSLAVVWPDWANFRPLGDCFLWTVSWNCILCHSFPQLRFRINFGKKWIGLHFGRIFHRLFWSHCLAVQVMTSARVQAINFSSYSAWSHILGETNGYGFRLEETPFLSSQLRKEECRTKVVLKGFHFLL